MPTHEPGHATAPGNVGLHRYLLTFRTDRRRHLFTRLDHVTLALSQILRSADEEGFAVVAYCFMPDELHLLIEGQTDGSDCKRFISRSKQYSAFHYARMFGGRLWQRRGFERVLRDHEATAVVARQILQHPVRAGLVRNAEDYPYLGSKVYPLGSLLARA